MPWQRRANSQHLYYVRKVRTNGRQRHVYLGHGPAAVLAAAQDARRQAEREAAHEAAKADRSRLEAAEAPLLELTDQLSLLVRAMLLAHGYHEVDRHWRRKYDAAKPG